MQPGKLYGIGIGPGDPELLTLKGARILAECDVIFTVISQHVSESVSGAVSCMYSSRSCATMNSLALPSSYPASCSSACAYPGMKKSPAAQRQDINTMMNLCFCSLVIKRSSLLSKSVYPFMNSFR